MSYVLTDSQLHRYLADAFRVGAESERAEPILRHEEACIRSEHHAREFVRLRVEGGLIERSEDGERIEGFAFEPEVWWAEWALSDDDRFGSRRPATLTLHPTTPTDKVDP